MIDTRRVIHVVVEKRRTGERIEGVIHDDGLQSLWPVETANGTQYVSWLDRFIEWRPEA